MDNMYRPTGGADPQDSRSAGQPTEQFWTAPPTVPGPGPQHPAAQPPPGPHQHYPRDGRHALRWSIGLSLALVLAAGGVLAGVALAGHGTPASSASPAGNTVSAGNTGPAGNTAAASQPGSQAAALNTALNAAGTPGTLTLTSAAASSGTTASTGTTGSSGSTASMPHPCRKARAALRAARQARRPALARAARAAVVHCRGIRRRLVRVFLLRGIDGQFSFRSKQGTIRTLAFERGVIQSVSSSGIVVRAADGTTWAWDLVSNTVVREHGAKTPASTLASGQPVWVGGPVVSGVKDARLIVIRPPAAPATGTPAPSASGS